MRVHLAGTEKIHFLKMVEMTGHKYCLMSYFHFKRSSSSEQRAIVDYINEKGMEPIIDSGLFTMMFGAGKGQSYDLPSMMDYTKRYLADIQSMQIRNAVVVECDVHKIVGMTAVFELRKLFKDSGLPTIYVWHREEELDGLMKLAAEEAYIAVSVPELRILFKDKSDRYQSAVFNLLGRMRRQVGILPRIHLLGNTIQETMETQLAYSCDSTSHLAGVRYGQAIVFDPCGKLRKMHIRSHGFRSLVDREIEANPLVREVIEGVTQSEKFRRYIWICFVCAKAFHLYQRWLDQRFTWEGRQ